MLRGRPKLLLFAVTGLACLPFILALYFEAPVLVQLITIAVGWLGAFWAFSWPDYPDFLLLISLALGLVCAFVWLLCYFLYGPEHLQTERIGFAMMATWVTAGIGALVRPIAKVFSSPAHAGPK